MAEPDFSVITPDWMKQGRDVADEWLRMQAGNQAQQRLRMQQQEQNALLPLKIVAEQQDQQLKSLSIAKGIKQRDDLIKADIAAHQLGPELSSLYKAGDQEGAMNKILQFVAENPEASDSPMVHQLMQNTMTALQTKNLQQRFNEAEGGRNQRAQEANDVKLQIQQAKNDLSNDPNNAALQLRLLNYYARLDALDIARQNVDLRGQSTELRRNAAVQGAVSKEAQLKQEGFTPTVPLMPPSAPGAATPSPQGAAVGQPLIVPVERPLTTGTVTNLQEQNAKLDTSISNVSYAIKQIEAHPEAFGPRGWVGEWAERFQGMVDPNAPMTTTGARTTAGEAAHDLIVSLKTDPQVSNFERHAIDEVVGKPSEFFTNPARVKAKFQTLLEIAAARRIRQGVALRQIPSISDLDLITDPEHIKSMAREGTLTNEQALEWARRHLPTK